MAEQLSLGGLEAPSVPTDRLFFALQPDAAVASKIAELAQSFRASHGLRGNVLAAERLHITLFFLGDFVGVPEALVERAALAVAQLPLVPFEVRLDRVTSFKSGGRARPLVLQAGTPPAELLDFQRTLSTALRLAGIQQAGPHAFNPHLTLLYDERAVADEELAPVSWTVRDFVLVRSRIGKSRHEVIGRWPASRSAEET